MKKAKKLSALFLAISMIAALAGCGKTETPSDSTNSADGSGTMNPIKVTVTQGHPSVHNYTQGYFGPFLQRVSDATGGAFQYDWFTDGELVPMGGEYDALMQKQADVAMSLSVLYDPVRFSLTAVTMLPTVQQDVESGTKAIQALWSSDVELADGKTFYELMFTDNGLVAWPSPAYTGQSLQLKQGVHITSPADFKNLRVRSSSSATEIFLKNLGCTPVSMTAVECGDAMSRNALEGIVMCDDWTSYSFGELLGDVIEVSEGASGTTNYIAVTTETWESWPQELRDAFDSAFRESIEDGAAGVAAREKECVDYLVGNGGQIVQMADLPQDVQDYIADAATETWYEWIDMVEGQGHPGKATAIVWRDCLIEAGATVPEALMALEEYTPNA